MNYFIGRKKSVSKGSSLQKSNHDVIDILQFLFSLTSSHLGRGYLTKKLTESQRVVLHDLMELGLIYQIHQETFFATPLGVGLANKASMILSHQLETHEKEGFIIVETNYRVYAYTQSVLQIAILSLFVELQYRFPNVVVGSINRESIRHALLNGITADQIIMYLNQHSHAQMRKKTPILPSTLTDQIRLWEMERNRMQKTAAVMYDQFTTQKHYDEAKRDADQLGIAIYAQPERRILIVHTSTHESLRSYIKKRNIV
jgi:transcription initiation factor TFIIH subunit 4